MEFIPLSLHLSVASRRLSVARAWSPLASCAAAAAIALAAPLAGHTQTAITETQTPAEADAAGEALPPGLSGQAHIMVEMEGAPATVAYAAAYQEAQAQASAAEAAAARTSSARTSVARTVAKPQAVQISAAAASQVKSSVARMDAAQQAIMSTLTSPAIGAQVLFRAQRAYNGIAMIVDSSKVAEIAKLPGVKAIHPLYPKQHASFTDVNFVGTKSFWTKVTSGAIGLHGENIKVAIIDSGLDYLHTDFGGPGTAAAYSSVTDTSAVPNGYFPSFKVPGGYDFAGDTYNADSTSALYQPTPHPDANPLDSAAGIGHGTSCASLIGGYGTNADGSTYYGSYDNSTPLGTMKISPGYAPYARIYPLRVFGTSGSTDLVTQALEYAIDPNGDGDFSDHYDVISMSLGSDNGFPDDADAIAAANAASVGAVVCSAAGNAGDSYYIVSAPSVAPGTLSVAATFNDQAGYIFNASVTASAPSAIAGQKYNAIYGSPSPAFPAAGLTNSIVYAVPNIGTSGPTVPLTNAAQISGKICLIDRGTYSFVLKCQEAQAAGAVAVIVVNNAAGAPIVMALDTTITIPAIMIAQADGATIKAAAAFDANTGVAANPVTVTLKADNGVAAVGTPAPDTIPSYTSRGVSPTNSFLKPDISAPAEVVGVAQVGTGTAVQNFNGTSSATPHVAGEMALLKQLHPSWTVEELLALAMNTSTHDLYTATNADGTPATGAVQYGLGRIAAGRIDLTKASNANVVAFNQTDRNVVSVSFGVVEAPVDSSISVTKNVLVENKGTVAQTYTLSYTDVTNVNGAVSFNFPGGTSISVPAGSALTVPVTMTVTGNLLKHTRDASVAATQVLASGTLARQWLSEKGGYLVLTPTTTGTTEPTIRLSLYAAPKPVSSIHVTANNVVPTASTGSFALSLSGASINTGSSYPTDIISLGKPFELQYVSTLAGSTNAPTSPNILKYVGVTSDYVARPTKSGTVIVFGIDAFGDATYPAYQSSDREIYIDTNQDGTDDYVLYLNSRSTGTTTSNVYSPVLVNLATNAATTLGFFTNVYSPASRDTNSFNNSATIIPVNASSLGLVSGTTPITRFNYAVATFDRASGALVDITPELSYDIANPGMDAGGGNTEPFLYSDLPGALSVNYNGAAFQANASLGLLMLHMHNGDGARSDVVAFRKPTITGFSPASGKVGSKVTITGTNFNASTVVTFNGVAAPTQVISANTLSVTVPTGARTGPIRVANAAGTSTAIGRFIVTP